MVFRLCDNIQSGKRWTLKVDITRITDSINKYSSPKSSVFQDVRAFCKQVGDLAPVYSLNIIFHLKAEEMKELRYFLGSKNEAGAEFKINSR